MKSHRPASLNESAPINFLDFFFVAWRDQLALTTRIFVLPMMMLLVVTIMMMLLVLMKVQSP